MVARLIREGHTGTLLVMDIDNFKRINDSYGHIAGDNTLRIFAKILKRHSRETDIVGRIGGDEFVVFFVDVVDREIITQRARELLDNLERQLTEIGYGQNCSASIGIAVYPFDGKEYNTLYNNADKSLYYVKRNGKNNFGFYSDEKGEETHQIHTTDLNNIRCMIEGKMMPETGVFQVEYEEFPQIYSYISRGIRRNHQDVQILLFTLAQTPMNRYTDIVSDEAMMALKNAVARSLRMVDVGTRYSNVQYIVILMDTNMSNGARVAERVIEQFYKIYAKGDVSLSYDIQTMRPKSR
jgi:diguanylate cyclase (GGDEF)-like protein